MNKRVHTGEGQKYVGRGSVGKKCSFDTPSTHTENSNGHVLYTSWSPGNWLAHIVSRWNRRFATKKCHDNQHESLRCHFQLDSKYVSAQCCLCGEGWPGGPQNTTPYSSSRKIVGGSVVNVTPVRRMILRIHFKYYARSNELITKPSIPTDSPSRDGFPPTPFLHGKQCTCGDILPWER